MRELWDAERTAHLRRMIREEVLSASQMAIVLGTTRSAIIGRAHRLKLKVRPKFTEELRARQASDNKPNRVYKYKPRPNRRKATTWQERMMARQMDLENADPVTFEGQGKVTFFDLEPHHCRWPYGDSPDVMFCGDQKEPGCPYCRNHMAQAYTRPNAVGSGQVWAYVHGALRGVKKAMEAA